MNRISTPDGTELFVKDWGRGQPIVFNHAYSLDADSFEDQMFFLANRGYRCVAHDRRGHGRSSQPWQGNDMNPYADDLAAIITALDLNDAVLVGHSTGGGVVARYIGRHGLTRVAKVILISSVTPSILKTAENPNGPSIESLNQFREGIIANRAQFFKNLATSYFGANLPGADVPQASLDACWNPNMLTSFPASYFAIQAFSETDMTEDLKLIDVPTLILHGDADQIVPVSNAHRSAMLIKNAVLTEYPGAPHALITTAKEQVNNDLLAFIQS